MLKKYYNSLNPFHLLLYGTVFSILARALNGKNLAFELSCYFLSITLYILGLVKYMKKK